MAETADRRRPTADGRRQVAMRILASSFAALLILVVVWVVGGPVGAWLNAPGLLLRRAEAALVGLPGPGTEPTLRGWLRLATALSALFWGLVAYVALVLAGRRRNAGPAMGADAGGGS